MTWFKVDDGFWSHPKTATLSDAAVTLWVRAGAYSCQHLTDGVIARTVLRLVGTEDAAGELVAAGLWLEHPEGWVFHDWGDYQETRDAVRKRRDDWRERQRRSRVKAEQKRRESSNESDSESRVTHGETHGVSQGVPSRPVPSTTSNEVVTPLTPQRGKRGTRIDPDWKPTPETVTKIEHDCPGLNYQAEHVVFIDYWIAQPGQKGVKLDWDATWRNWMRRKHNDSPKRGQRPSRDQANMQFVASLGQKGIGT
ncbi:hypothetical protein ACSAGD_10580 [Paramicrobacterium sp. CJ85]|uniref:hypothetical protein n=1 Tax=Paramicrobacterium sp. CJ85 TaxID=3445355 RepID=UPI003F621406